jgi:hypothetical protein
VVSGVGFVVLAVVVLLVWLYPNVPANMANTADVRALQQRIADTDARLHQIEQRPPSASAADLQKLATRVDTVDPIQVGSRLDVLSGRIEALSGRSMSGIDEEKQKVDAIAGRIAGLEKAASNLATLTDRLNRIARLQEAGIALSAGKPVGDVPSAPAALARFAKQAPPTEAQLRISFPEAERAALAAAQPPEPSGQFLDRVWDRAQGLVTVKRGDDVVVGNPTSIALATAKAALDVGDLPSAVAAVKTLTGPPRQAMDPWLAQATSLLGARAALADMAGQV